MAGRIGITDESEIMNLIKTTTLLPLKFSTPTLTDSALEASPKSQQPHAGISKTTEVGNFCQDCLTEGQNEFGVSYLRRIHQIPGVTACPIHECKLEAYCSKCVYDLRDSKRKAYSVCEQSIDWNEIWGNCRCGSMHFQLQQAASETEVKFAQFCSELLNIDMNCTRAAFALACKIQLYRLTGKVERFRWIDVYNHIKSAGTPISKLPQPTSTYMYNNQPKFDFWKSSLETQLFCIFELFKCPDLFKKSLHSLGG